LSGHPVGREPRVNSYDFGKASDYHAAARELVSEAKYRDPQFTDKEKINLEIFAKHQIDVQNREMLLEMARGNDSQIQEREVASSRTD